MCPRGREKEDTGIKTVTGRNKIREGRCDLCGGEERTGEEKRGEERKREMVSGKVLEEEESWFAQRREEWRVNR